MIIAELLGKIGFDVETHGLERVGETLEGIQHKVSFLAAAEVLHGLFELAERFGGVGEQLNSLALQSGLTVEEFQKLSFAAGQNAIGQEEMSGALAKLNRNLYEAKKGTQNAVDAFAALGITPEQVASFRNSGEAMKEVANRIALVDDPIKRQALTMELMGRGSSRMIKLLVQGGAAIDKYGEHATKLGIVLSSGQTESLEEAEDAVAAVTTAFRSMSAVLAASLAPAFTELAHQTEEFIIANKELIRTKLEDWAVKAAFVFGFVFETIKNCAEAMANFVSKHPELVENLTKVYVAALLFGLGMHGVEFVLGTILSPLGKFMKLINFAPKGLSVITRGLVLFQGSIAGVLEILAELTFAIFPKFALWLLDIAAVISGLSAGAFAGLLAGLALLVALIHDSYIAFTGGKVEDMWLYQLGEYVGGKLLSSLNAVRRFMGMTELTADDIMPETREKGIARRNAEFRAIVGPEQETMSKVSEDRSGLFLNPDYKAPRMPQMSTVATNLMGNLTAIAAPEASKMPSSEKYKAPDINQVLNINTKVDVQVPPGATTAEAGELFARKTDENIQKILRDAKSNLSTAVRQ